ncbi:hypothetical protein MJO28_008381 [Puccinia striiformis f. sp. tritici]|uniref:Uncharacterized protein n=1 Tax=Puccinia striiformis f. sp. tritici TaxID=168172 RepID=A0ACC0EAH9_9BASI|nr:hypothetical protein Pst134EB_016651 [Puccinia striiformis f. sp. tritici]KAI7949560.1 hypothetical protein MJO28_008381 [Puccinia striiformis f. sp. tritici]KAI7952653.1 hypothetical protein MJO29_008284 [Puccinia striiformis f. sp. tritici]
MHIRVSTMVCLSFLSSLGFARYGEEYLSEDWPVARNQIQGTTGESQSEEVKRAQTTYAFTAEVADTARARMPDHKDTNIRLGAVQGHYDRELQHALAKK